MNRLAIALVMLVAAVSLVVLDGCVADPGVRTAVNQPKKDYYRALPPGAQALRKITDPTAIPDYTASLTNLGGLKESVENSIHYMAKPSSRQFFPSSGISHRQVVESLKSMREILSSGATPAAMNRQIKQRFDTYISVGCDDQGTVLFTGYYTPIFDASRTRTGKFQHPLHMLPANHVKDPITGETKGLRRADGSIDPNYPDRGTLLASGNLQPLVYLSNPFEAYVAGVQGSAFLRMTDGSEVEVGYAGNNGYQYTSLGL